jgi:ABC-type multidrug transport system fused ATPase/permease subunit
VRTAARSDLLADRTVAPAAPDLPIRKIFGHFWPETEGLRGRMAVGLLLVMAVPAATAAEIWIFKILIDDVLVPRDFGAFPRVAILYVSITLLAGVLGFANQYLAVSNGEAFLYKLRNRLFAHLHRLSSGFLDQRPLGDVLSRLTGDVAAIESLVLSGVVSAFSTSFQLLLFTGVLFYLNWTLALLALVTVPLFWLISRTFSSRLKKASRESRRRAGAISAVAEESLGNALLIQAYGRQDRELERFAAQSRASVAATLRATRLGGLFGPSVDLLEIAGVLLIMGTGVWQLSAGNISLGGLLVFLIYLSQLYGPVRGLGQLSNSVFSAAAAAERIIELLEQRPLVPAPVRPIRLSTTGGHLALHAVSFRYPAAPGHPAPAGDPEPAAAAQPEPSRNLVLADVSVELPAGTTTALVGTSGAGKSTLIKLLLRLYDPTDGTITLDGHDLRALDPHELRRHMAVVLQETLLLDGSIAENIQDGDPNADHDAIVAAAKSADAHEFISALPQGYDTRVGQRGRLLSGGQRQRIAIARAMIRNAAVLIMDEPTASLDVAASERIMAPLRRLMSGRTTLVISHNLLTVATADHIVYIEHGRVTETGTHTQLLAREGRYAQLYRLHQPGRATAPSGTRAPTISSGLTAMATNGAPVRTQRRPRL